MDNEHSHRTEASITLSWDPELVPGNYLHVPADLVCAEDLSAEAKVLYLVLLAHAMHTTDTAAVTAGSPPPLGRFRIQRECGLAKLRLANALGELAAVGLVTLDREHGGSVHLRSSHTQASRNLNSRLAIVSVPETPLAEPGSALHIPLAQTPGHIEKDTRLLIEKLGISEEVATSLAQLAADRGCFRGYVAEVVQYATTTPGIKNPAGCAVELIRRNERRRPVAQVRQPAQNTQHALDPEKYTSGKYAFLFRPHRGEGTGRTEGEDEDNVEAGDE